MRIVLGYLSRHIAPGEDFMSLLPTGLPVMAAMLEGQGHEVLLANFSGLEPKKALRVLREFDPGLAGFSLFTHNRLETFELAGLIRRSLPGCRIILGGPHASPLGDEILARETCIDWVVQGEGETILSDLVRVLAACDHTRGLPGSRTVTASGEAMHLLSQGVLPPRASLVAPSRISDLDTLPLGCSFAEPPESTQPVFARDRLAASMPASLVPRPHSGVAGSAFVRPAPSWARSGPYPLRDYLFPYP